MHAALKFLIALVVGAALGLLATWLAVGRAAMPRSISDGPWQTNLAIGNVQSDPYTRAATALHGLLALNRSETLYYTAPGLDGRCRYRIRGHDPNARWWSITAYGPDDFLIPNAGNHYSVSATSVRRDKNGAFVVDVGGPSPPGADSTWIAAGARSFSLTLRLYNPGPSVTLDPEDADLPGIDKVWCP